MVSRCCIMEPVPGAPNIDIYRKVLYMAKVEYGLQMYSLRDVTEIDLKDALRQVAEMGYKYIEFAGFFGHKAEDVKAWLEEYGLVCSGTHTGGEALAEEALSDTIAYHKTIGCANLIIPGMDWSSQEKLDANITLMNRVQPILAENGITLGYHNHSGEFLPTPYGKVVEEEILARTNVALQIDTWWAYNAGVDPVAYCRAHRDRIHIIHLKDGIAVKPEYRDYLNWGRGVEGRSVGSGEAPIQAIRQWCLDNDVRMVIESESLDPTGPEEVKRCIDYLRTLE